MLQPRGKENMHGNNCGYRNRREQGIAQLTRRGPGGATEDKAKDRPRLALPPLQLPNRRG